MSTFSKLKQSGFSYTRKKICNYLYTLVKNNFAYIYTSTNYSYSLI